MKIFIDNKPAVLKQGSSFDYVSENRLFLGRDGYTWSITFPLKDCPENVAIFGKINRADVSTSRVTFLCSIMDRNVTLNGNITITKISNSEVQAQFTEGKCSQTIADPFEQTFINCLELGFPSVHRAKDITPIQAWRDIDAGQVAVALPWINESYPTVPNNWVVYEDSKYRWNDEVRYLSWQPYLIEIARRICDAVDYKYDFSEWENSPFKYIIVCNTMPAVTRTASDFALALPEWTVSEFFEKLELFLMCEFDFDHKIKTVKMRFSTNVIDEIAPVHIEDVVDEYSADVSAEDDFNCDYIGAKRLAYKECSHSLWNYYSCDWLNKAEFNRKEYDTLAEMLKKNFKRSMGSGNIIWGEADGKDPMGHTNYTDQYILYAKDCDTEFIFRSIGLERNKEVTAFEAYANVYVLQPLNVFGSGMPDDDTVETEDIEFVPACIMETYVDENDDMGFMMFLNPASGSGTSDGYTSSAGTRPSDSDSDTSNVVGKQIIQKSPAQRVERGESSRSGANYDEIIVAFWRSSFLDIGYSMPYPIIDGAIATQDWRPRILQGCSMRISGKQSFMEQLPKVAPNQKYKFSWIADSIPSPRAIFYIRGKRYLCEKITATFTENGMSQLLKGEFYPLLDD